MCERLTRGTRCGGSHGEAVFSGEFWVSARVWDALDRDPAVGERLHRGFCSLCHRPWGDTWRKARCTFCGVEVRLNGVKGACPVDPKDGDRVVTEYGEAVFNGYCWTEAWLHDLLEESPPDFEADDGPYEPLCVAELGGCSGCGAYWGNAHKSVRCVFCGSFVSLT